MLVSDERTKKTLFIRLSSLGDVLLAMSALSVSSSSPRSVDWLVASEFSSLLDHHPGIRKVWGFNRKLGLKGWQDLSRVLWDEGYDEVYDLHRTLRTKLLRLFFLYWSFTRPRVGTKSGNALTWHVISKQRLKLYGYFLFKSLWPKSLRPEPIASRSARLVGGSGDEKPDARHLLAHNNGEHSDSFQRLISSLTGKSYICVMPGSKWAGKKWPVESYAELLSRIPGRVPVVMGTPKDLESTALVQLLEKKRVPVISAVGLWNLKEVAQIISGAWRYLGNDTGLGHLAEAVGVPSLVIFGPTREDMGFGPWRPESRAIGKGLACRPCGKDGRYCYRFGQRYACMTDLKAQDVILQAPELTALTEKKELSRST
jgi:ADP-heptose:LPS heptosyltransferase